MPKEKSIEVFQNALLRVALPGRSRAREALLRVEDVLWQHAETVEVEARPHFLPRSDVIVFQRSADDDLVGVSLFLVENSNGYEVTNIVPVETGRLEISDYNWALNDFIRRIAQPARLAGDFTIEVSQPAEGLTDWMSEGAARALIVFSKAANKATNATHPLDRQRWEAFLIAAHRDRTPLNTQLLRRWLCTVEDWPDEVAEQLAIEFETGMSLLDTYDAAE
jgi:hypothetical protein